VELWRRGDKGSTLKKRAHNIAEKPRTNLGYAFIKRRDDSRGELVETGRRGDGSTLKEEANSVVESRRPTRAMPLLLL